MIARYRLKVPVVLLVGLLLALAALPSVASMIPDPPPLPDPGDPCQVPFDVTVPDDPQPPEPCMSGAAAVIPEPEPGPREPGPGPSRPDLKVLGYHVSWREWTDDPAKIPWEHLTHLSYFAVAVTRLGTIGYNDECPAPYPAPAGTKIPCWTRDKLRDLATAGHAHNVKVGLTLVAKSGAPDELTYKSWIHDFLSCPPKRTAIVNALYDLLVYANADGVDVDIEFPVPADGPDYVAFIQELAQKVHTRGGYVYVAVPQFDYPRLGAYYADLAAASDALALMGYGYHHEGGDPGPVSPISIGDGSTWPETPFSDDLTQSIDYYSCSKGIPLAKLLLGLPFYGTEWPTTSTDVPGTRAQGPAVGIGIKFDAPWATDAQRNDVCERRFSVSMQRDATTGIPYQVSVLYGGGSSALIVRPDDPPLPDPGPGETPEYRQLFCEDLTSMQAKFELARSSGVAGVFFWAENLVPRDYPFWKLLDQYSRSTPPGDDQAPEMTIEPHDPVSTGQQVHLEGHVTDPDDPVPAGVILQWTMDSGPAPVFSLEDGANEETFTFTPWIAGTYEFTLTATDGVMEGSAHATLVVEDASQTNEY